MACCRCCCLSEPNMFEMKSAIFLHNQVSVTYLDAYKFCNAGVNNIDKLLKIPNVDENPTICQMCMLQLESAYIFIHLCAEATLILEQKCLKNEKAEKVVVTIDLSMSSSEDEATYHQPPEPKKAHKQEAVPTIKKEDEDKNNHRVLLNTSSIDETTIPPEDKKQLIKPRLINSSPSLDSYFLQKRVQCKFCNRIFVTKGVGDSLWMHSFDHRGYYPFNCTEAECIFHTKDKKCFQNHLKKCHNIDYDDIIHGYHENYQNIINFIVSHGKQTMVNSHTNHPNDQNLPKKFQCDLCEMRFTRKIQQMRHYCAKNTSNSVQEAETV